MDTSRIHFDSMALIALSLEKEVVIFVPFGNLTLMQITQLSSCKKAGATIHFSDNAEEQAKKFAIENSFVLIDNQTIFQVNQLSLITSSGP